MTREDAILWMQVLKHSKINWVGEKAEEEDIIKRCEEAEQEAFDMAIEALSREQKKYDAIRDELLELKSDLNLPIEVAMAYEKSIGVVKKYAKKGGAE